MKFLQFSVLNTVRWAAPVLLALVLTSPAAAQTSGDDQAKSDSSQAPMDGEVLFATSCGWCHQQGGRVAGRGPKLAGSPKDDEFILNRIRRGKQGAMPSFERTFNDEQIHAILAYIRALPTE